MFVHEHCGDWNKDLKFKASLHFVVFGHPGLYETCLKKQILINLLNCSTTKKEE